MTEKSSVYQVAHLENSTKELRDSHDRERGKIEASIETYLPSVVQLEMAHKLVELIAALNEKGIKVWLIGGYALDAIYGKLTRDHHDFDLLIEEENIVSAQKIIQELGYHYSRLDSIKGLKWAHSHPDIEQEGFKLELGLLKKGESENTYRVGPFDLPKSYFPNETQGILLQIPLRTITLEGNIKLNELLATLKIEELDEYHHALHNEVLLEKIQEKKS